MDGICIYLTLVRDFCSLRLCWTAEPWTGMIKSQFWHNFQCKRSERVPAEPVFVRIYMDSGGMSAAGRRRRSVPVSRQRAYHSRFRGECLRNHNSLFWRRQSVKKSHEIGRREMVMKNFIQRASYKSWKINDASLDSRLDSLAKD